jgi:hypothetical protein
MNTKLILVEGLPGCGKSTTARLINDILTEMNVETELFLEGNLDHPADYDGVSCFTEEEFDELVSMNEEYRDVLTEHVMKKGRNYFLPYQKIRNEIGEAFPDELANTIFTKDIYELPLEKNIELITDKWAEFSIKARTENKVYIFECCFIQNPVTVGMVKHGASKEAVMNYVTRLSTTIECLNPELIYVEQSDLPFSFQKAVKERSKEWSQGFIDYYTSQGYGKKHHYTGIEGTLKVLEARREVESEIFDALRLNKQKINNSQYDMSEYKSRLEELIKV